MKLYNPIVGGKRIIDGDFDIDIDKEKIVDNELGEKLLKKYPFLANLDSEEYQPEGVPEVRKIELQNSMYSYRDSSRLIDSIKEQAIATRKTIKDTKVDEVCDRLNKLINIVRDISKKETIIVAEIKKSNRSILRKIIDKFKK